MSSADFRQIASSREPQRADRVFRAAVSAFCSLTRPTRREIAQLDDLTTPLVDIVSAEARRFVAAAISECGAAPAALVRKLAEEPVEISAPILVRSPVLMDIDLITLIGRHGIAHARAIRRRDNLHPTIASLVEALESSAGVSARLPRDAETGASGETGGETRAEEVRRQLRGMMRYGHANSTLNDDAQEATAPRRPSAYDKLRATALTGVEDYFHRALADVLGIGQVTAARIARQQELGELLCALRYLALNEEQAYLIVSSARPRQFTHAEAIRRMLERYRGCDPELAEETVRAWKADSVPAVVGRWGGRSAETPSTAENSKLRAS